MIQRAPLKWAGGKARLLKMIVPHLPQTKILVEPFLGSATVFLNTEYEHYILSDSNPDLIQFYEHLKIHGESLIDYAKQYFQQKYNTEQEYYRLRDFFNHEAVGEERSALFLYLNRHGFNGLCRYNQQGIYNVPFGQYTLPYFPNDELKYFASKAHRAAFKCMDYTQAMINLPTDAVVYADPPYVPLSATSNFTEYAEMPFKLDDQRKLAILALRCAQNGTPVLISNHDTQFTREIYEDALLTGFKVKRSISANTKGRNYVKEILAYYCPEHVRERLRERHTASLPT